MDNEVPKPNEVVRRATRISRRVSVQLALKVRGEDYIYNVNTVNFSKTGLRVQTRVLLELGQPVVALPSKGGAPTGYCRVVWTDGREAGLQLVH